jgi:hypothetical protein
LFTIRRADGAGWKDFRKRNRPVCRFSLALARLSLSRLCAATAAQGARPMRDFLTLAALIAVPATVAAIGCNNSPGLTVTGDVVVDASGATSSFTFEQPVRLDGAAPSRAITGGCTLASDPSRSAYGVVVDLYGPLSTEGRALRAITIMTRTDATASGTVEAELGADTFRGTCSVDVPFVSGNGQVRVQATDCVISGAGETASVDLDLTFDRCTVTVE